MTAERPGQVGIGRRTGVRRSETLSAAYDGELGKREADALHERLASDAALERERDRFTAVSRWIRPAVEPDPGFVVRFRARRRAASVVPRWTWRQLGVRLAAVTAALVVAAALSIGTGPGAGEEAAPTIAEATPTEALVLLEGEILGGGHPDGEGPEPVLLIAVGSPVLGGFGTGR